MWYKYNEETNEWYYGAEIHFPDGTKITASNPETKNGWEWHDEPPQKYLDSLEEKLLNS